MNQRLRRLFRNLAQGRAGNLSTVFRFASRYCDVAIVPWFLDAGALYAYLAARVTSLCLPTSLGVLGMKARPQLKVLAQTHRQNLFRAAAARINLGYLMICGAMALFVLSGAPYFAMALGVAGPDFEQILMWLVIGQSAPVLFGATGLLMHVVDRGAFYDMLLGLTALFFLTGVIMLEAQTGAVVAQTFAAAQLTQAALCAMLLTQCGVWPGLTALFHKEIKLF